ncbi:hypothetical protein [Rhodomicrobium lacus]|uniref:hypothetical protein n=1 Tax=Rhodomicrobium lacus TaxID=2498452 RepID=UPI000F8E2136|nr:hypothetical protein [Rhodomicrobium lacus]
MIKLPFLCISAVCAGVLFLRYDTTAAPCEPACITSEAGLTSQPQARVVSSPASDSSTSDWSLITEEEIVRDQGVHPPEFYPKPPIGAPTIKVNQPDASKPIKSPVTIEIEFQAEDGATIIPSSIRITYGWLEIDITQRVLAHAKLTPEGLRATNAKLPQGHHSVTLKVADSKGRVASKVLEFTVV